MNYIFIVISKTDIKTKKKRKNFEYDPNLQVPPCPPYIMDTYKNSDILPNFADFVKKCENISKPITNELMETCIFYILHLS